MAERIKVLAKYWHSLAPTGAEENTLVFLEPGGTQDEPGYNIDDDETKGIWSTGLFRFMGDRGVNVTAMWTPGLWTKTLGERGCSAEWMARI